MWKSQGVLKWSGKSQGKWKKSWKCQRKLFYPTRQKLGGNFFSSLGSHIICTLTFKSGATHSRKQLLLSLPSKSPWRIVESLSCLLDRSRNFMCSGKWSRQKYVPYRWFGVKKVWPPLHMCSPPLASPLIKTCRRHCQHYSTQYKPKDRLNRCLYCFAC